MAKIKKDDLVVIIAGKDRGQQGRVLDVDADRDRVIVEGINRVQRHIKANTRRDNQSGGIITVEAPVHISNVMLVDPQSKKGTRVGYRTQEVERDGRKRVVRVRIAKRSGKDV